MMIESATEKLEEFCDQKFLEQTWAQYLDCWPMSQNRDMWWDGVKEIAISELYGGKATIDLLIGPVLEVLEFNTYADDGVPQLFPSTSYIVDNTGPYGRISLPIGGVWPTTILRKTAGIEIKFKVGLADDPINLPQRIKQAILSYVAYMYEHRGDSDQEALPKEVATLISGFKSQRLGNNGY